MFNNDENNKEKDIESTENELLRNNIKESFPKIIEKGIEILNDTGNKIQFFKKQLKQIDNTFISNEKKTTDNNINIKEKIGKELLADLLNKEKEIFLNLIFLNKLFPSYPNIPDKLFDSNIFLEICFIDLIISHNIFLDLDIAGQLILYQYKKYENKSHEFLNTKKKYLISLLKLSITLLDTSYQTFDLKKYIKDIIIFVEKIINCDFIPDLNKLSVMPGLISKITKLFESDIKITSKMIEKICQIEKKFIEILFCDLRINENINDKKNFCEFFELFVFLLFNKYRTKIKNNLLENVIQLIINYINIFNNNKNYTKFITNKFYENTFYVINNQIFDDIFNFYNNNDIYEHLEKFNFFDEFYDTYINCDLFDIDKKNKKIGELIIKIENTYYKKEFLKFNAYLIELLGNVKLILHYNKIKNINDNDDLCSNLFSLFTKIIKLNKSKIFFEVINSYEFIFLNINKSICNSNIISEFFKSVINTYNSEYKLQLLFIYINHLYQKFPLIYDYFFEKSLNKIIETTKNFNNKLIKKKFATFTQLNESFNEVLNFFIFFEFFILFQNFEKKLENKIIKKIAAILNFYYDLFIDTDNEENFNKAKINDIKLSLINFFLMNLSIYTIEKDKNFLLEHKNKLILLSMFNYSNNAKIIKYTSSLLILNLNQEQNLKIFLKNNYTFLINSILNKIIYFNISNNNNNTKNNLFHLKNVILNVFSSLIELINNFYFDDDINKIFVVEFYNYIQKLFPYFDNNIKEKNIKTIDIMLEIFIKISLFQKNVLLNECKKMKIDINKLNIDIIRMMSDDDYILEKNDKNYELIKNLRNLKNNLKLQKCNICRKLILRLLPLILSKKINFISKSFQIVKNYILLLFVLPLEKEEEENFSEEDPSNVIMSSSLGPIMYELWKPIIFAFHSVSTNLSLFFSFFEIFDEISNLYPEFFDGDKIFNDLIPCLKDKINFFSGEYKEGQINRCIGIMFDFLKKICAKNGYNKKYKNDFEKFMEDNKKYFFIGCDDNKKSTIENDIKKMMFCFTKS